MRPVLERRESSGVAFWTDPALLDSHGVLVAFSERVGGASDAPYATLNLAAHVGDDAATVDENRARFLDPLGLGPARSSLTTASQVHGSAVVDVGPDEVGSGAFASTGPAPLPDTDAMLTRRPDVPLMMFFADCVPVVLVATAPVKVVGIAHCGWRGALAGLAATAAAAVARAAGCGCSDVLAYVGPHIGPCHYQVAPEMVSQFEERFATIAPARDRLDLGAVVSESLNEVGVLADNTVSSGICTADGSAAFYSYRGEGTTGRHAALAAILGPGR